MLRLSDFAGRVLREDDLDDLGRPTGEVIEEAIDSGRTEEAKTLARNLIHEWKGLHDLYCDWIWDMLTKIGRKFGEGEVYAMLRATQETWMMKRDLEGVPQDDRRAPSHAHRRDDARAPLRAPAGGRCRRAGGRRALHHRHGPLRQRRSDAPRRPHGQDPLAPWPAL